MTRESHVNGLCRRAADWCSSYLLDDHASHAGAVEVDALGVVAPDVSHQAPGIGSQKRGGVRGGASGVREGRPTPPDAAMVVAQDLVVRE